MLFISVDSLQKFYLTKALANKGFKWKLIIKLNVFLCPYVPASV